MMFGMYALNIRTLCSLVNDMYTWACKAGVEGPLSAAMRDSHSTSIHSTIITYTQSIVARQPGENRQLYIPRYPCRCLV